MNKKWFGPLLWALGALPSSAVPSADSGPLESMRAEVSKLAAPYFISGADLGVSVSQSVFAKVTAAISALPAEKRRATFNGISLSGYVWSQGGGFLGCGGFAEINSGGRDFHFAVDIGALSATWQPQGRMAIHLVASANAWGTIHGQVRGPAGMCSGPSWTYPLGRWSCDCPLNGGFGSVVGISADKGSAFDGYLTLEPKADGQIGYTVVLTSPQSLSVTASAGLERIGSIGIPFTFSLPSTPLLQGTIAGVLKDEGVLQVAGSAQPYRLDVTNLRVHADASGLQLLADARLSSGGT